MVNIILEFNVLGHPAANIRLNIRDQEDKGLCAGDEIGFDLAESDDFFYSTVSRKVYIIDQASSIYYICRPRSFNSLDELAIILEKFKAKLGDRLAIENH